MSTNKGFTRRPHEFLAWEEKDYPKGVRGSAKGLRSIVGVGVDVGVGGVPGLGDGRPYVEEFSQGGRRSSWAGRWEAVYRDSCIWRWWEWASRREEDFEGARGAARRGAPNKGFAKRPWEFLAWEMRGRM